MPKEADEAPASRRAARTGAPAAGDPADCDMAPAQRLVLENELAEQFGVTPGQRPGGVIEWQSEGLVERDPNRGARVRVVTVEEAVAITECRMVLEGLCVAKAAVEASEDQLDQLLDLARGCPRRSRW